jgi:hypothetical protein
LQRTGHIDAKFGFNLVISLASNDEAVGVFIVIIEERQAQAQVHLPPVITEYLAIQPIGYLIISKM